jgi:hypothetical protein
LEMFSTFITDFKPETTNKIDDISEISCMVYHFFCWTMIHFNHKIFFPEKYVFESLMKKERLYYYADEKIQVWYEEIKYLNEKLAI